MMDKILQKRLARWRKHRRIRQKIFGTAERPRLCVYRSNMHIYAQIIDDVLGVTLASASTLDPEIKKEITHGGNREAAEKVGNFIAKRALAKGIKEVVFDRGGNLFHGRVKALADGARSSGLKF